MRRLGRYQLLDRLHTGGSGELFLARAPAQEPSPRPGPRGSDRGPSEGGLVAIKRLPPAVGRDPRLTELLSRESERAIAFSHRAAAGVREVGRDGATSFVVMEHVAGRSLAELLHRSATLRRPLARELIAWLGAEIAAALAEAHRESWEAGTTEPLVHAGLAPSRILVSWTGRAKVVGFGLGRTLLGLPTSLGRLAYRAPELLEGAPLGVTADIYGLGVILFEAFSGRPAFRGVTGAALEAAILGGERDRLAVPRDHVSEVVAELVWQMMSRRPEARPERAESVERALRSQLRVSDEILSARLAEHLTRTFGAEREAEERDGARALEREADTPPGLFLGRPQDTLEDDLPSSADAFGEDTDPMLAARPAVKTPDGRGAPGDAVPPPGRPSDSLDDTAPLVIAGNVARPAAALGALDAADTLEGDRADLLSPSDLLAAVLEELDAEAAESPSHETPIPDPLARPASLAPGSGSGGIAGVGRSRPALRRIGRFEISRELARSGASRVYEGRALKDGALVLVKVLDSDNTDDPRLAPDQWTAAFSREVALARKLEGPGLPRMIEAGQEDRVRYLAYDRVAAVPLSRIMSQGRRLDAPSLRKLVRGVALALAALHDRGVVHCNVLAKSVLVTRSGLPRLDDLSYAAPISGPSHPLLGTNPFVLSPEWLAGHGYGPAADQFALGALLYELLTGTRPFRGLDDRAVLAAIREKEPIPPRTLDPRVSPFLSEVAMRALEKDPERRWPACDALAAALG